MQTGMTPLIINSTLLRTGRRCLQSGVKSVFFCSHRTLTLRPSCRQNELEQLPEELGDLLDLRTLGVSSNKLVSLPASLGQLALLEHLFANGNRLHSLPAEVAGLMNLKKVTYAVGVQAAAVVGYGRLGCVSKFVLWQAFRLCLQSQQRCLCHQTCAALHRNVKEHRRYSTLKNVRDVSCVFRLSWRVVCRPLSAPARH